jgi:glucokinase
VTVVVGVDIGGTKTSAALVDADGRIRSSVTAPTPGADGPGAVLDTVSRLVGDLGGEPAAAGVGSAGVVDARRGTIVSATDVLAGWAGTPLRDRLEASLGLVVAVDNDVHAHALGELWRGAAAGADSVLFVADGTGIGASLVLGGRVLHGAHAVAGHAGHVPVAAAAGRPCTCGGVGHLEAVASGPAMLESFAGDATHLSEVDALANAGDPDAVAVLAAGGAAVGSVVGGLMNTFDPAVVVIGGGVAGCGPAWWGPLRDAVAAEVLPVLRDVPVVPAMLGPQAALVGAARLAWEVCG